MNQFTFQKATKKKAKLRAAIYGPSGSGKTYSALRIATGIAQETGGRIAVIDTEFGSASKYADRFDFDCIDLTVRTVATYSHVIQCAAKAGYSVLVIDSMTHAWRELLEEVDKLASSKYKGNTWSAWSEGTPKQREFVQAILKFPGHVIATIRSKTEWQTEQTRDGKSKPVRVGLTPEQGKGIEYEFDLLLSISTDHVAVVEKDRTGKFQDQTIAKPGESFGQELVKWLSEGVEAPKETESPAQEKEEPPFEPTGETKAAATSATSSANGSNGSHGNASANGNGNGKATPEQQDRIRGLVKTLKITTREFNKSIQARTGGSKNMDDLPATEADAIIAVLESRAKEMPSAGSGSEQGVSSARERGGAATATMTTTEKKPAPAPPNTHPANSHPGFATVDQVARILVLKDAIGIPWEAFRASIVKRTGDAEKKEPGDLKEQQAAEVIATLECMLKKKQTS